MSGQRDQARRAELEHMLLNLRDEQHLSHWPFVDYLWQLANSPVERRQIEAIELLNLYDRNQP